MSRPSALWVAALVLGAGTGCWEQVHPKWFSAMKEQPAVQHQEGRAPWTPPENTVPAGGIVPRLPADSPLFDNPLQAPEGNELVNPFELGEASLARGKRMYNAYCAACHAPDGTSNPQQAPVALALARAGAFPNPLGSSVGYSDGQLYNKIRYGKPNMPAYPQIPSDDRWHIVNYLRVLFPREG